MLVPSPQRRGLLQVLELLTEDFVIWVLRAASSSLDFQLLHLDECWHSHAVHAAYPEIITQGLLKLNCTDHSYSSASTALVVFSQHAGDHSLCLLNATLLSDFSHSASPSALNFSFAFDSLLRHDLCNLHVNFAAIAEHNAVMFLHALARCSALRSLHLEFQELSAGLNPMLLGVVVQLTSLETLHITVHQTLSSPDDSAPSTQSPSVLQLSALTGLTSLTLEGFCCGDQCPAHSLAKCLTGMLKLQQLDIAPKFTKSSDVQLLASSASLLAGLSSFVLKGECVIADDNQLRCGVAGAFPQSLVGLTSLRKLHLNIDAVPVDDELKPLVKAVQSLVCLESLSFSVQEAKKQSLAVLAALSTNGRVLECTSLQLRASEYNSKDVDAALCMRLCSLPSLQRLSLHMCIIQDNQRGNTLARHPTVQGGVPLLAALSRLTFLVMDSVIDRDGEEVPEPGARLEIDGFLTALGSASKLQHLQVLFSLMLHAHGFRSSTCVTSCHLHVACIDALNIASTCMQDVLCKVYTRRMHR